MKPWHQIETLAPRHYACGYCSREVSSEKGWFTNDNPEFLIYICPGCSKPTLFTPELQTPKNPIGRKIEHLPDDIDKIHKEIRDCTSVSAFTASVLACRKLLMHIAVDKGVAPDQTFIKYVDYLEANHFAPPLSNVWLDKIRTRSNEANHELDLMTEDDATTLLTFVEMILTFMYELPEKAKNVKKP